MTYLPFTGPLMPVESRELEPSIFQAGYDASTNFAGLAEMVGADDISVAARPSGHANWITVHAGQKCVNIGVDTAALSNATTRGLWHDDGSLGAHWMHPASAQSQQAVLVSSLRGSSGEVYVIALLFETSGEQRRYNAEKAFRRARAVLFSAVELSLNLMQLRMQLEGSRAALDRLDVGIVLLNGSCNILHENIIAQRLLKCGLGVRRQGRSLLATDLNAAVRLRVAIDHVLFARSVDGTRETVPLLSLKRNKGQRPLLASVFPVRDGGIADDAACVIIFIFDPERDINHLLQSACQLYGLSPVETALACLLAQGESIAEAALVLKIKELTARGYLKQIFIKTGVNRQSALVRILLSSVIHLGDDPELKVM